jgi:hypothetical protein
MAPESQDGCNGGLGLGGNTVLYLQNTVGERNWKGGQKDRKRGRNPFPSSEKNCMLLTHLESSWKSFTNIQNFHDTHKDIFE